MPTPARSSGRRTADSGGTTIAHGATEYAVVTSCPLPSLAAALVAPWQATRPFRPLRSAPPGTWPGPRVPPHELPASLREAGLTNWIREPLDDAVDQRRRIIMPPATAVMGTPAAAYQGALLAEARHQDTVFMMGDDPGLP